MTFFADVPPAVAKLLVSAGWIDGLLLTASVTALVVVVTKNFAVKDPTKPGAFKVAGVEIPLDSAWIVFLGFTVGHLFATHVFLMDMNGVGSPIDFRSDAWSRLTGGSLFFFHDLGDRVGGYMRPSEPASIVAHATAILVFFAIFRYKGATWRLRFGTVIAATLIVVANWLIGTVWAINASQLSVR